MGSTAEVTEPSTGTEKHHHQVKLQEEDEDEQIIALERKTSSLRHGKKPNASADSSTFTTNTSSSASSSFSGDGTEEISDFRNGDGVHTHLENLEVPELETEILFHEEHDDGKNCIVHFDGEQGIWNCRQCDWTYKEETLLCFETKGSESAGAEPDAHESQNADHLNEENKPLESENGPTSEDNQDSREIEELQDGDASKDIDVVDQLTHNYECFNY